MLDVAIIGGGPAGLGAAIALKERGVAQVVVLERESEAGGIPRHCGHPPFGLHEFRRLMTGPVYAKALVAKALAAGVDIRTRQSVVALQPGGVLVLATPDGPERLEARRVLLATGARERTRAARLLGGDRPAGVLNTGALQAAVYLHGQVPFKAPVVVGTELVGLSALSTCRRHGIRPVAMVEEAPRTVARWPLGLFPRLLRIPVHYNTGITEILGDTHVEGVRLTTGATLPCDGVILSGQFLPEASLIRASALAYDPASGGPVIDQFGRCSDPAFFAAGNLLRPIETAGWCHSEGWDIGEYIADDLEGGLPPPEDVEIIPGKGLKYVVPQRLALTAPLHAVLQLRASAPTAGQLQLRVGTSVVYRRPILTRPERRILIDLDGARIPPGVTRLVAEIVT
jgi:NADPH-dependent 2,4-dienoyl-CoA reductase/sulfur reductase-like enzyme